MELILSVALPTKEAHELRCYFIYQVICKDHYHRERLIAATQSNLSCKAILDLMNIISKLKPILRQPSQDCLLAVSPLKHAQICLSMAFYAAFNKKTPKDDEMNDFINVMIRCGFAHSETYKLPMIEFLFWNNMDSIVCMYHALNEHLNNEQKTIFLDNIIEFCTNASYLPKLEQFSLLENRAFIWMCLGYGVNQKYSYHLICRIQRLNTK